jgi:hypothetical protein
MREDIMERKRDIALAVIIALFVLLTILAIWDAAKAEVEIFRPGKETVPSGQRNGHRSKRIPSLQKRLGTGFNPRTRRLQTSTTTFHA